VSLPDAHQVSAPRGTIYTFKMAGDVLPMHRHGADDVHITCIMRGRFRIHGPDPKVGDKEFEAGAFIDWAPGVDHEFIALTDNARIANSIKAK
jgi:cupin superfamily acireductone dioxygenase involved in methionine salvage